MEELCLRFTSDVAGVYNINRYNIFLTITNMHTILDEDGQITFFSLFAL